MSVHEAWAQALVANAMDVVKAWDVVYPDGPNSRIKSAKSRNRVFSEQIAVAPGLWVRIAQLQAKVDEKIATTGADVIRYWELAATVDRRELSRVVNRKCPMCDGDGFGESPLDKCDRCGGTGNLGPEVEVPPSDSYSPGAAAIFEGAEQTKNGIKIHTVSKSEAWMVLARHHGLLNDKLLLAKAGEPPELPPLPEDPNEAARLYAEWVKNG